MMFITWHDVYCSICGSSISMLLSNFCVLLESIIIGLGPGVRVHRLLARFSMPKTPVTAFGQAFPAFRRPPSDNCTRHFEQWKKEGANFTWPEDLPKSAVMMKDQSTPPFGTYSFLKKTTLTKNPIERSMGVFWALGGRRGGGFWVALWLDLDD